MKHFNDLKLSGIWKKLQENQRLNFEDGLTIYNSHDLIGIGFLADFVRQKIHGKKAYYVINRHVNYTNVCINRCRFCAFARDEGQEGAYTLSVNDIRKMLSQSSQQIREVHMVGGLNPSLSFDYYLEVLKSIREILPNAAIKAFTAVEIDYLSRISGLSLEETFETLKAAGLDMLPGGGAEVMSERVRHRLFPRKIGQNRWLEVIEMAHRFGITTNATMLYGHIETIEERVDHLLKLRQLQDKTGGCSAFIPLAFHSKNTQLSNLPSTTGFDDLKNIAAARLLLDNFPHIKAYWIMIGEKLAQVALSFGADDLDGTILEEKITHMAGATSAKGLTRGQIEHLITAAGFAPVQRDAFYEPVDRVEVYHERA